MITRKRMKYYCLWCVQKISLIGLVLLLFYLSWVPQEAKILIESETTRSMPEEIQTVSMDLFRPRQQVLENYCRDVNLSAIARPRTILYSRKIRVAYCPLYMAGSTAMKYALLTTEGKQVHSHTLYNITLKQGIHSDAQKLALGPKADRVNGNADVLLIVRDPWQRLVSSYRKLVEFSAGLSHAQMCQKLLNTEKIITFELFLQCIITTVDRGLKLLTHIQPAYEVCSLCRIKYTRIVRFENIESELATIFQKAPRTPPEYSTLLKSFYSSPVVKSEYYNILPYLSSVSRTSKQRIHEIYKLDFILFGYTFLDEKQQKGFSSGVSLGKF